MMRLPPSSRRGFTIVEVITALTIIAIIGLAMTKLILGQTRSFQYDNGARRARAAARSAMNILITDLRMVQDTTGGVTALDAINNRRIDVRVPVVFGFVCALTGTGIVASLVPTDSFQTASSKYGGYAVRNDTNGTYTYVTATASDSIRSTGQGLCRGGANIYADTTTIVGRTGGVFLMSPAPPGIPAIGSPMFRWQAVTYEFKASGIYPGRLGLFRTTRGLSNTDTTTDELVAPFKSTARFNYYLKSPYATRDIPTASTPGTTNNLRGFQIFLPAESSDTMPTRNTPQSATTTTAVFFKNTRAP